MDESFLVLFFKKEQALLFGKRSKNFSSVKISCLGAQEHASIGAEHRAAGDLRDLVRLAGIAFDKQDASRTSGVAAAGDGRTPAAAQPARPWLANISLRSLRSFAASINSGRCRAAATTRNEKLKTRNSIFGTLRAM